MKTHRHFVATVVVCMVAAVAVAQPAEAYRYYGEYHCVGGLLGKTSKWEHLRDLVRLGVVKSHKNWFWGKCNNW